MRIKRFKFILSLCLIISFSGCDNRGGGSRSPISKSEDGLVPDKSTAIKVAEAIWLPRFGDGIYDRQPFKATLKDSVWIVEGTLPIGYGGVPYIEIRKSDCMILTVYHTK